MILSEPKGAFNGINEGQALTLTSRAFEGAVLCHSLTVASRDLAFELFDEVLEFDNEPVFEYGGAGVFGIAFLSTDCELQTILTIAREFQA